MSPEAQRFRLPLCVIPFLYQMAAPWSAPRVALAAAVSAFVGVVARAANYLRHLAEHVRAVVPRRKRPRRRASPNTSAQPC